MRDRRRKRRSLGRRGVSLFELVIVMIMFAFLLAAGSAALFPAMRVFSSQSDRMVLQRKINDSLEQLCRQALASNTLQNVTTAEGFRFRVLESGVQNSYILYLYNPADLTYDNTYTAGLLYILMRAQISSIGAAFPSATVPYGSGRVILPNVVPPATSDVSTTTTLANLDLTVRLRDEDIRVVRKIRKRGTP